MAPVYVVIPVAQVVGQRKAIALNVMKPEKSVVFVMTWMMMSMKDNDNGK